MLYTVTEISEILGFSKVTIYNRVNSLKTELKPYIKRKKNVLHIDDKGLLILKEDLGLIDVKSTLNDNNTSDAEDIDINSDLKDFKDINSLIKTIEKTVKTSQEDYINSLLEQIKLLTSELDKKDAQLNNTLRLLENSQVLIREEKEKILMLESKEQKQKRGIFSNLFKKN